MLFSVPKFGNYSLSAENNARARAHEEGLAGVFGTVGGTFFGPVGRCGAQGAETATRQGGLVAVSGTRCVHGGPYPSTQRGFTDSDDLDFPRS